MKMVKKSATPSSSPAVAGTSRPRRSTTATTQAPSLKLGKPSLSLRRSSRVSNPRISLYELTQSMEEESSPELPTKLRLLERKRKNAGSVTPASPAPTRGKRAKQTPASPAPSSSSTKKAPRTPVSSALPDSDDKKRVTRTRTPSSAAPDTKRGRSRGKTPTAAAEGDNNDKRKTRGTPAATATATATPTDNKRPTRTRASLAPQTGKGGPSTSTSTGTPICDTPSSKSRKGSTRKAAAAAAAGGTTPVSSVQNENRSPVVMIKKLEWTINVYGIPDCPLPCRETQFQEIWKFLFENVTEKNSGCMYVSGVPGTGKTVIVQAVVDTMKRISEEKKKIQFKYLYINGLTLASPDKIWKRMFKGLELRNKTKGISTKEALKRLDSYFESHQRDPVILVVDELDQILDKQQSILYQLLEWSSHAKNMFSFVAIFNTMSLPENGLAMRNYSRMGFKRAVFPPYSYDQLQTIVANMLSTFTNTKLNAECVSLLSRKVAAISGDARRALEIARRAMEIAENGNLSGIQAVSNAFKEIFSSAKIETIKYTSLLEQLVLKTICDEIRCSGVEEVLVAKIYESVLPKAAYEGMSWPKDEILKAMMRLAVMRILIVEDNSTSIHKRVLLKVPVEDVNFALGIHTDLEV